MAVFDGKTHARIVAGAYPASAELAVSPQNKDIKPSSIIGVGNKKQALFGQEIRTPELLKKFWKVYETGGLYSQAIDTYAYAAFANGYRIEGPEAQVQEVEDNFAQFDFDTIGMQGIIQALVYGDSMQEAVATRGNQGKPEEILARDSGTFEILFDPAGTGIIQGYKQTVAERTVQLKPEQIIHLQLIPSGNGYGISLIGRAMDDILRDTKTAEATAEAIDRHGFKKWHVKVGQPGEVVDPTVVDKLSIWFYDLHTKNEFVTTADVDIKDIDESGLEKMEDYSNVSLMRVAAALGVPEELIGLKAGSTDATAVSRIEYFMKTRIASIQRQVARCYTLNYINRIVEPGQVKLVFNDVSEEDELKRAKMISLLVNAYSRLTPETQAIVEQIIPTKWVQSNFNISGELVVPKKETAPVSKPVKMSKADELMDRQMMHLEHKNKLITKLMEDMT